MFADFIKFNDTTGECVINRTAIVSAWVHNTNPRTLIVCYSLAGPDAGRIHYIFNTKEEGAAIIELI